MSRCKACDRRLTDSELRRKDPLTNDFAELCSSCWTVSTMTEHGVYVEPAEHRFTHFELTEGWLARKEPIKTDW